MGRTLPEYPEAAMKRPKVITFDVGHTLIFPCFEEFMRFVEKHFCVKLTMAELSEADKRIRYANGHASRKDLQDPPLPGVTIFYSGGLISELLPHRLNEAKTLVSFLKDCMPAQDSWFSVLTKDAIPCLEMLQTKGFRLGVISNAHGKVLQNLTEAGVDKYFEFVVDSGLVGFEKPDARIFQYACELAGIHPSELLHIGDSVRSDVFGALGTGSQAALYDPDFRVHQGILPAQIPHFRSLRAFAESFCPAE
jgi:putative hydrolase of the HAD superfamily